jgi:hypothetical protein
MQVLNIEGFEKRILSNVAKSYSVQLEVGQSYSLPNPLIALTITDFVMFPEFEQLSRLKNKASSKEKNRAWR